MTATEGLGRAGRSLFPAWVLVSLAVSLSSAQEGTSASAQVQPAFRTDIEAALEENAGRLPAILVFAAPWCEPCRQMEEETWNDPEVRPLAEKYVWIKIDVDRRPELAAQYSVASTPHVVILDAAGRSIGQATGFMSAARFTAFVKDTFANPSPDIAPDEWVQQILAARSDQQRRETIVQAVEALAVAAPARRKPLAEALVKLPPPCWNDLLALMDDERLAVRAAAAHLFAEAAGAKLPFQPFAEADVRQGQIAALRRWLEQQSN